MKSVLLALSIFLFNSISFAQFSSNLMAHTTYSSKVSPLLVQPATPFNFARANNGNNYKR